MVSENAYDVMMFMMLCTSMQSKQVIMYTQSSKVLRFRLAWGFIGKHPLEV